MVCPDAKIEANLKQWGTTLIGHVMERRPYYARLKRELEKMWRPKGKFKVCYTDNSIFLFRFASDDDCVRILEEGPCQFDRRLIVLRRWEKGMKEKKLHQRIPI